MKKYINLPKSNLVLYDAKPNKKGQKCVRVGFHSKNSFKIVTASNLPKSSKLLNRLHTADEIDAALNAKQLTVIRNEVAAHIMGKGTAGQQSALDLY